MHYYVYILFTDFHPQGLGIFSLKLIQRQTQPEDLSACANLLAGGFTGEHRALIPDMMRMWDFLIRGSQANSVVIEDRDSTPYRIVGFGLSVCLSDGFMDTIKSSDEPYPTHRILDLWKQEKSPVLTLSEIRAANKGEGLHFFGMHTLWCVPGMSDSECAPIRDRMLSSLFATHSGYKVKSFSKEIYGKEELGRHLDFGLLELNGYPYFDKVTSQPFLVAVSRDEALDPKREARFVRRLFISTSPICSFTPADQELLQLAQSGLSESECASVLDISKNSVKSRWNSIYNHIPVTLERSLTKGSDQLKGRALVSWLRHHPEELRPTLFFKGVDLIGD